MKHLILIASILIAACGAQHQAYIAPQDKMDRLVHTQEFILAPEPTPESLIPTPTPEPPTPDTVQTVTQQSAPVSKPMPAPAPVKYYNRVIGPGVNVAIVGQIGAPCMGTRPPVPWGGAYWDNCHGNWLLGHPPFFGAMNSYHGGEAVTVWDESGDARTYHIDSIIVFGPGSNVAPSHAMTFQVCTENTTTSPIRVLGAD